MRYGLGRFDFKSKSVNILSFSLTIMGFIIFIELSQNNTFIKYQRFEVIQHSGRVF